MEDRVTDLRKMHNNVVNDGRYTDVFNSLLVSELISCVTLVITGMALWFAVSGIQ